MLSQQQLTETNNRNPKIKKIDRKMGTREHMEYYTITV